MSRISRQILGSRGFNSKTSKFLLDPRETQILENILVTSGTKKRRQQYARWKYDKVSSNAIRCIGTYKKSFCLLKDANNLKYNSFGSGISSTIEIKFRLPGVGGYSLKSTMYVASRQIHGTGYTFQLNLINTGSNAYDEYRVQLIVSDGGGTTTLDFTSTKVVHGKWYMLTLVKDVSNTRFRALLEGVFTENIAFGATKDGAQSVFGVTRDDSTYSDVVLGAKNDLTDFTPIDISEFRLWNEARSDANVLAYYDREVPAGSTRTNMICYINFSETHDGHMGFLDKINSNCAVFFGGQPSYKDINDYLVFDGTSQYGLLNPTGGVLQYHYNQWGGGNGAELVEVSEVAFKVLKLKQCNIIGGLSMYYDSGTSKYGFRFKFTNNGATTTIDSGGVVALADIDVTEYYVAVRAIETGTPHIELWVNGIKKTSINYVGGHGHISGETGKYVAANPTGTGAFSAIRLKWIRVYDAEILDDTYFSTKYNQEVDIFKLNEYSHGVQDMVWVSNTTASTMRRLTGTGTNLNAIFASGIGLPDWNQRYFCVRENKDQIPGENYQDALLALSTGPQTWEGFYADTAVDPWSNAGYNKITNKEGFFITTLLTRYNGNSWKDIKIDKDTGGKVASNNSFVVGTLDRDRDPGYKLELYYYVSAAIQKFDNQSSFIGGTQRLNSLLSCRFLAHFKDKPNGIDSIISIVGTSFNVFDRATKVLTQYPISILPNSDKAFVGDFLDGQLYITDGTTKIHVYVYKRELKVVKWDYDRLPRTAAFVAYVAGGPWSAKLEYAFAPYNRELDQFGPLSFPESDGTGPQITITTNRAVQINTITPSLDFYDGVTDIAIFRTKDLNGTAGIVGHYWLLDFVRGNSQGAMDWSQADTTLSQRYPIEISTAVDDMSTPSGEFLVSHNKRIWISEGSKLRFSRIGSELHTGVIKPETYLFPGDHFLEIQGNRDITGLISYYNKILFVFTSSSMDIVTGNDQSDFEVRRIHEGIGCVNHRTLFKYGDLIGWLGLDDIYVFRNGVPEPLDPDGRISDFIRLNLDSGQLQKAFSIINRTKHLLELHAITADGIPIVIVYDFKSNNFSIFKDIRASYGCEVNDSNNTPSIYYGTMEGFIVNENSSKGTYQPDTGSIKTTVTSYDGVVTITVAASDLQITEAGLIGNTIYIVRKGTSADGSVVKAIVDSNTATTISFRLSEIEYILGTAFTPTNGDDVYIAPVFTRWKSSAIFVTNNQDTARLLEDLISDNAAAELLDLAFVHNRGSNTNANAYFALYRDGQSAVSKRMQIKDLDKDYTRIQIPDASRAKFFEIEAYHLHDSSEFELISFVLGFNITRDDFAGTT